MEGTRLHFLVVPIQGYLSPTDIFVLIIFTAQGTFNIYYLIVFVLYHMLGEQLLVSLNPPKYVVNSPKSGK